MWPRPYQGPYPPVWSATGSRGNARVLGEKGYVMTLGTGFATRALYDAYRAGYVLPRLKEYNQPRTEAPAAA